MFCYNCGTQLPDGTAVCNVCQKPQPQMPPLVAYQYNRPKIPGRGLGISGMILGIIGLVFCTTHFFDTLNTWNTSLFSASGTLKLAFYFSVLPILAVSLAGAGKAKGYRNDVSTSGIVMGIISLVFCFICLCGLSEW